MFHLAGEVKHVSKGLGKVEQAILSKWYRHLYERPGDGFYKNGLEEKVVISLSGLPKTVVGRFLDETISKG